MSARPLRLLTIAGSDSGGGAGIQADLKTFAAHGCHGMSAITALTAQNTLGVTAVHVAPAELVAAQIDAVFDDIGVDAIKIGMLASAEMVETVAATLRPRVRSGVPMVLDPVMVAQSGDSLIDDEAVQALLEHLIPLASLVTPNLPEAARLTGRPVGSEVERLAAARQLGECGDMAVLVKGGHGEGDEVVDLLLAEGAFHRYAARRIETRSNHGTGCTLSSAIACRLAAGEAMSIAVSGAIEYLRAALEDSFPLGQGNGPVHHFQGASFPCALPPRGES